MNLLKKDPETEGNDSFNVATMLNDNWDKIDAGHVQLGTTAGTAAEGDHNHDGVYATAAQGVKADAALPASSYTAADVKAKLLTIDGSGSTIDADMVDGKHADSTANNLVVLDASAKVPIANVPTGTTSSTVSVGNHNHDTAYAAKSHETDTSKHVNATDCIETGTNANAEGYNTVAVSNYSHTEGRYSLGAYGKTYKITEYNNTSKTITLDTVTGLSVGDLLQIKVSLSTSKINIPITAINGLIVTLNTTATITSDWKYAIELITAQYYPVHAEGYNTLASGESSHAEGNNTIASGLNSHSEGIGTLATGDSSHAEGTSTTASGAYSHAEGNASFATGYSSHAEGDASTASGDYSHAGGYNTTASGAYSYTEGRNTEATADRAHAEGYDTTASGIDSHAGGYSTIASGNYSQAGGYYTQSKYAQTAIGRCGTVSSASDTAYDATTEAFMIGNGTNSSTRGLAFKVLFNGQTYADGAYTSTGADYAEYFEWLDSNPGNEDRVGYFVTLDGDKLRKANSLDNYILGIVSATPSIIGDNQDDHWQGKYLTDDWGRVQYHEVIIPDELDSEGNIITPEHAEIQQIYNPDWDSTVYYTPREKRKEWAAIGLMGKLLVRDDGTCIVNGYCKSNDNGVATNSESGYRVMKRVSSNIVQVFV